MSERQEVDVADQEIEGAGEERKAERLHDEERIGDERRDRDQRRHHRKSDGVSAAVAGADVCFGGGGFEADGHVALPKRPEGRISSTSAMMTNTTVFDASG